MSPKALPIADQRVPNNDRRNNYGKHLGSRSFLVSKVENQDVKLLVCIC